MTETKSNYIIPSGTKIKLKYSNFANSRYNNINSLKELLQTKGPMMVSIWADNNEFKQASRTKNIIFDDDTFEGKQPDHAVLLVGYGFQGNTGYWILQNSWGRDWGNSGFFAVEMGGTISEYFGSFCYVDEISGKFNFDDKYATYSFRDNLTWKVSEGFDDTKSQETLKTGFNPPPVEDAELDTFYSNISQPILKSSSINQTTLNWAGSSNPIGQSIVCKTESQGFCGSCWLFALLNMTSSALSLYRYKKEGKTFNVPLSKQYMMNNMKNMQNSFVNQRFGCEGGNSYLYDSILSGATFYMNGIQKEENGVGAIASELCTYVCGKDGHPSCDDGKCKEGPAYISETKDVPGGIGNIGNIGDMFSKYGTYVIIGIIIIIIFTIVVK